MDERSIDIEGNDLSALIAAEIATSKSYADNNLKDRREEALEYYNGTMRDLKAPPNRSSVVSRDVQDVVSWTLPAVVRVFTSTDRMVVYAPTGDGDEEYADQASDFVNYVFFTECDGYRVIYDATHDSLVAGNAIVYHTWDESDEITVTEHTRVTPDMAAMLLEEDGVEVIEQEQAEDPEMMDVPDPATGQVTQVPVPTFNLKLRRIDKRGRLRIHTVPPENFFMDPEAVRIEDARFVAYRHENKTRSDLIEMGFDRTDVEELATSNTRLTEGETLARDDGAYSLRTASLKSQDLIDLYECYVRADANDDGIAETLKVWWAGHNGSGKVLKYEEWEDDVPYSDVPCYPMPHRWEADGLPERTKDIQRAKTALLRATLDNLYASVMPMLEIEENSVRNPDILINPKWGGLIWKRPGTSPIVPHVPPFVADKALQGMEYLDMVRAQRTGISRTTMALDPDAINNQTATASQNQRDAGYTQIEMIARNMAEFGWKRVFKAVLKLVIKHQDRPKTIRLRDRFVPMDPRVWNAGMDCTINVGLGTGSRERDMAMLSNVLQSQMMLADRFMAAGAQEEAIDLLPKVVTTLKKIAESAGIKNAESYYPTFGEQEVAALKQKAAEAKQQPDPKIALEQAKMQADQQKMQADMQMAQQKAAADTALARSKAEADAQLRQQQQQAEIGLKREQLAAELALRRDQLRAELGLRHQQMQAELELKARMPTSTVGGSDVRMGGEPG